MVRLINIYKVIFRTTFIVILLFLCGQCRKKDNNASSMEEIIANIPCWNQSWKNGQWNPINGSVERGDSVCIFTQDDNTIYFSMCALCQSMQIRDPNEKKERIILTPKGLQNHEHVWIAAFSKVSLEKILSGDILLLVYKGTMHCVKIKEIYGENLSDQGIQHQIAKVTQEDIKLTEIDLNKLIWRNEEANRLIPVDSGAVSFKVEAFKNEKTEKIERHMYVEYDQYYDGYYGPESKTDEESTHIAIIHNKEVEADNTIDLRKFRFKTWEDGLGNRCDKISEEKEARNDVIYWHLHNSEIRDIESAVENSYLVSISNDKRVILKHLDLPIEKTIGPLPFGYGLSAMAVSEDGNTILVGGDPGPLQNILKIYALYGTYEMVSVPFNGTILNICFYNKDECIAYITAANELYFFNLKSNKLISSNRFYGGFVDCTAISPDKKYFAALSKNEVNLMSSEPCKLTIFDQEGNESLSHFFKKGEVSFLGNLIFLKPDLLSLCLAAGEMYQWEWSSMENKWESKGKIKIPTGLFSAIECSQDGAIIWLSRNLSILAIDSSSGELLYEYTFDDESVRGLNAEQIPIKVIKLIADCETLAIGFENGYIALLKIPVK